MHPGKGRQEAGVTARLTGVYLRQGSADPCLQKGKRALVHPLIESVRRHGNVLPERRGFRDPWRQRRRGVTPASKCHEGQKEFAGNFRRTPDKTRVTGCRFDLFGGKKLC
jgi:hypothetical protein